MWVTAASSLEIMILCSVTVPAIGPHSVSLALVVAASMPVAGAGTNAKSAAAPPSSAIPSPSFALPSSIAMVVVVCRCAKLQMRKRSKKYSQLEPPL